MPLSRDINNFSASAGPSGSNNNDNARPPCQPPIMRATMAYPDPQQDPFPSMGPMLTHPNPNIRNTLQQTAIRHDPDRPAWRDQVELDAWLYVHAQAALETSTLPSLTPDAWHSTRAEGSNLWHSVMTDTHLHDRRPRNPRGLRAARAAGDVGRMLQIFSDYDAGILGDSDDEDGPQDNPAPAVAPHPDPAVQMAPPQAAIVAAAPVVQNAPPQVPNLVNSPAHFIAGPNLPPALITTPLHQWGNITFIVIPLPNAFSDGQTALSRQTPVSWQYDPQPLFMLSDLAKRWQDAQGTPAANTMFDRLPRNYRVYWRQRADGRVDRYVYGHPKGHFRSAVRFYDHFEHMMVHQSTVGCTCEVCSKP